MEKEKRKQPPQNRSALLYTVMTVLGCAICFGCFLFWAMSDGCTWNHWNTPNFSVPQSSTLDSENIDRKDGRPYAAMSLIYVDRVLSDDEILAFFDSTNLCVIESEFDYYARCHGAKRFWGTNANYNIFIQSTNQEQGITEYTLHSSWNICPARGED